MRSLKSVICEVSSVV